MKRQQKSEATSDLDRRLRTIMSDAIARTGKSRAEIADEMAALLGRKVTERMINDWVAPGRKMHRFPLAWTAAFCQVTEDNAPLELVAREIGLHLLTDRERALVEIGESLIEMESVRQRMNNRIEAAMKEEKA